LANCYHNSGVTIRARACIGLCILWGVEMRTFAIAVIIASLTLPAYAQDPEKEESNKAATEKKKQAEEIEKAYKDAAKRLPPPPPAKKPDPWSNIR
jgi:hypothetical protein